jgi:hypothetical protein
MTGCTSGARQRLLPDRAWCLPRREKRRQQRNWPRLLRRTRRPARLTRQQAGQRVPIVAHRARRVCGRERPVGEIDCRLSAMCESKNPSRMICNLKLLPLLFPTGRQTLCTPASASAGPSVRVPCAVLALSLHPACGRLEPRRGIVIGCACSPASHDRRGHGLES